MEFGIMGLEVADIGGWSGNVAAVGACVCVCV